MLLQLYLLLVNISICVTGARWKRTLVTSSLIYMYMLAWQEARPTLSLRNPFAWNWGCLLVGGMAEGVCSDPWATKRFQTHCSPGLTSIDQLFERHLQATCLWKLARAMMPKRVQHVEFFKFEIGEKRQKTKGNILDIKQGCRFSVVRLTSTTDRKPMWLCCHT